MAINTIDVARTVKPLSNLPNEDYKMCYRSAYADGIIDFTNVLREFLSSDEDTTISQLTPATNINDNEEVSINENRNKICL